MAEEKSKINMTLLDLKEQKQRIEELRTSRNIYIIGAVGSALISLSNGAIAIAEPEVSLATVFALLTAGGTAYFTKEAYNDNKKLKEEQIASNTRVRK